MNAQKRLQTHEDCAKECLVTINSLIYRTYTKYTCTSVYQIVNDHLG